MSRPSRQMADLAEQLHEYLVAFGPATTVEISAEFGGTGYVQVYRALMGLHRIERVSRLKPDGGGAILWWAPKAGGR